MVRPLILTLTTAVLAAQDPQLEFFEKQVRPILVTQCYACHGPKAKIAQGGLRVDYREALLRGGHSGAAVVPGKPDVSRLILACGTR